MNDSRMFCADDCRQIRRIRACDSKRYTYEALGAMFNCSAVTIMKIVHGTYQPNDGTQKMRLSDQSVGAVPDDHTDERYTRHWTGHKAPPPVLPVRASSFIRPPTREQLMGRR